MMSLQDQMELDGIGSRLRQNYNLNTRSDRLSWLYIVKKITTIQVLGWVLQIIQDGNLVKGFDAKNTKLRM